MNTFSETRLRKAPSFLRSYLSPLSSSPGLSVAADRPDNIPWGTRSPSYWPFSLPVAQAGHTQEVLEASAPEVVVSAEADLAVVAVAASAVVAPAEAGNESLGVGVGVSVHTLTNINEIL